MKYLKSLFESLTADEVTEKLQEIENKVRDKINIRAANPIYTDRQVRLKWMSAIDEEIQKMDSEDLIKYSNEISEQLEDDGYHTLRAFLILRRYIINPNSYNGLYEIVNQDIEEDDESWRSYEVKTFLDFMTIYRPD